MARIYLDVREKKPVNPKGNQPLIFIGMSDVAAEAPIFWPPDVKSWLVGKDPDAGKDWGQEDKGVAEDETVGWNHWLNVHEFEETPRDSEGQGSWHAAVHRVAKSQTWLSKWTTTILSVFFSSRQLSYWLITVK